MNHARTWTLVACRDGGILDGPDRECLRRAGTLSAGALPTGPLANAGTAGVVDRPGGSRHIGAPQLGGRRRDTVADGTAARRGCWEPVR